MRSRFVVPWTLGVCALLLASVVFANGVFQSVNGDVKAAVGSGAAVAVSPAQRFQPGTTISTGANSRAILRFDDGQAIVLHENSEFRVDDYRFTRDRPQDDNIAVQLLKGALRSVTGLIGQRSRNRVMFQTPNATIGIRGTDFMIVSINPVYVSVLQGAIGVSNAAGTVTFSAGALGTVATAGTLAAPIAASALPAAASSAFGALSSVTVGAGAALGAGGASTGATGAGAAGGALAGTAAGVGVGVAAVVAVSGSRSTVTTTASHH